MATLNRTDILAALERLGQLAAKQGLTMELNPGCALGDLGVGGRAMAIGRRKPKRLSSAKTAQCSRSTQTNRPRGQNLSRATRIVRHCSSSPSWSRKNSVDVLFFRQAIVVGKMPLMTTACATSIMLVTLIGSGLENMVFCKAECKRVQFAFW